MCRLRGTAPAKSHEAVREHPRWHSGHDRSTHQEGASGILGSPQPRATFQAAKKEYAAVLADCKTAAPAPTSFYYYRNCLSEFEQVPLAVAFDKTPGFCGGLHNALERVFHRCRSCRLFPPRTLWRGRLVRELQHPPHCGNAQPRKQRYLLVLPFRHENVGRLR